MSNNEHDLDALLGRYRPRAPGNGLRGRIVEQACIRSRWSFLEAMAAMLLVGVSLGQIGASVTRISTEAALDDARTLRMAGAIDNLDLALSPKESESMARRLAAGESLLPLPLVHAQPLIETNHGVTP